MKEFATNMFKHPFATILVFSGLATGIVTVIGAVKDYRVKVTQAKK